MSDLFIDSKYICKDIEIEIQISAISAEWTHFLGLLIFFVSTIDRLVLADESFPFISFDKRLSFT